MQQHHHPLVVQTLGTPREIISLHFGPEGQGQKVYIQAGLHADEHPGMLVLHHLRLHLEQLEAEGRLTGEVVLVPVANPIGLGNYLFGRQVGRFELSSRENFNRHYPDLAALVADGLRGQLGAEAATNVRLVRQHLREALATVVPRTELESLRLTLMRLACDADCVLDVHCDSEAMVHLYVHSEQLEEARSLAGFTGAYATLHALEQGGNSFDETFTRFWYDLRGQLDSPDLPLACFSATVELRGVNDVSHELAERDAKALLAYLAHRGMIAGVRAEAPAPPCEPTPLSGVEVLSAPHPGIVAYRHPVGEWVEAGMPLADVVDPLSGRTSTLSSQVAGMFYARVIERFAEANTELTYVAGSTPLRDGCLLGA